MSSGGGGGASFGLVTLTGFWGMNSGTLGIPTALAYIGLPLVRLLDEIL